MALTSILAKAPTRLFYLNGALLLKNGVRSFITSSTLHLKQIVHTDQGDTIEIAGVQTTSPRSDYVVKTPPGSKESCPLCRLDLDLKHTDVLILSQFVDSKGKVLPKTVTKLCNRQNKRVYYMVKMAQRAGLMPDEQDKQPLIFTKKVIDWTRYKTYYEEETIEGKRIQKQRYWRKARVFE